MSWTKNQINQHKKTAHKLTLVKDEARDFLTSTIRAKGRMNEADVVRFVKNAYKKHGLINDDKKEFCIVAFGKNTKEVHYFPSSSTKSLPTGQAGLKLKPDSLILLDIWARLPQANAPYADMTWMFFAGQRKTSKFKIQNLKFKNNLKYPIPKEILKTWGVLIKSRDKAIEYMRKEINKNKIPRGLDVDRVAHDVIGKAGFGHGIKHTIGHSLGFKHPHGDLPGINWREYSNILQNVGYTIEPGIYLPNFGMRTEIDFYISDKNEMIITTPIQKFIEIIN